MQYRAFFIMADCSDKNNTEKILSHHDQCKCPHQSEKDISQTKMQLQLRNR